MRQVEDMVSGEEGKTSHYLVSLGHVVVAGDHALIDETAAMQQATHKW